MIEKIRAFNQKVAITITTLVSSMTCAYLFVVLALTSLPNTVEQCYNTHMIAPFIAWLSQSFIQLVLLPIIMVGQDLKDKAHHERHKALRHELLQSREK